VGFGEPVEVVGPRLRTLVIRLALDPGRVVLGSQLIDAVSDEDPPAGATNALQSLVARLRRLLPDVVETHQAGYRLALDPDALDAVRFQPLAAAGRRSCVATRGRPGRRCGRRWRCGGDRRWPTRPRPATRPPQWRGSRS
jgi:DNA-binding SARP family transcriptional activator